MTLNLIGVARARGGSSFDAASPPPIGNVTPNTGAFTAIELNGVSRIRNSRGTNGYGIRFWDGTNEAVNFQGFDTGTVSYAFFSTNRQFNGTAWVALAGKAALPAGSLQVESDQLAFYTFVAGSNTTVERMRIGANGASFIADTDFTFYASRARIDGRSTDIAHFSHLDMSGASQYAIRQNASGATIVNAATGQSLILAINASAIATITATGIVATAIDATPIGGTTPAAGAFTTLLTSGAVTFNDAGADVDFRVEGDTDTNLFFLDASLDTVTIGTTLPSGGGKFNVSPAVSGKGVVIRANATTPGNMQEWQSGTSGTALASMSGRGLLTLGAGGQYTNAAEQLGATITGYFTNDTYPPLRLNNQNSAQPASALGIFGSNGSERTIDLNWNGTSKFNLVNSGTLSGVLTMKTLVRESIGGTTPAAGFGAAIALNLHSSTTINQSAARIRWLWTTATHASRVSNLIFSVYNIAAETDVLTLTPTGVTFNTSLIVPASDGAGSVGSSGVRWGTLYALNALVNTARVASGTTTNPALVLGGALTDTAGLYYPSLRTLGFVTGTAERMNLSTTALTFAEGINIALGTTKGTKIGTAGGEAGQKLAFFNSTPITQPLLATGVIATPDDIISVLQALGLVRQS